MEHVSVLLRVAVITTICGPVRVTISGRGFNGVLLLGALTRVSKGGGSLK